MILMIMIGAEGGGEGEGSGSSENEVAAGGDMAGSGTGETGGAFKVHGGAVGHEQGFYQQQQGESQRGSRMCAGTVRSTFGYNSAATRGQAGDEAKKRQPRDSKNSDSPPNEPPTDLLGDGSLLVRSQLQQQGDLYARQGNPFMLFNAAGANATLTTSSTRRGTACLKTHRGIERGHGQAGWG